MENRQDDISFFYTQMMAKEGWRFRYLWKSLIRCAVLYKGDVVIDISCGNGAFLRHLGQERGDVSLTGICDTLERARDAGKEAPNAEIMYAEPSDFPWLNDSFNIAFCWDPEAVARDEEAAFRETYRVLKPGGQFICVDEGGVFSRKTRDKLKKAGFTHFHRLCLLWGPNLIVCWKS